MKNIKLLMAAATILFACAFTAVVSVDWKVKEDYSVQFTFGQIHSESKFGHFKGLKANISFDEASPENSKITASIDAATVDLGHDLATAHAKEPDVLDAVKHPVITFESTAITKSGTRYDATGKLTIKGITKEIKFPFNFKSETFTGSFTIQTKDFNITRKGVAEEITIVLRIPVVQ
jgi:polyisoprenoid-binding protein YceI